MLRRLHSSAVRRPLAAFLYGVAAVCGSLAFAGALAGPADSGAGSPRLILGRVWFDHYPEKANEEIKILIFLGGGIGFYESGSAYRASHDIFDFERQGDKLAITFLHDKKSAETRFTVSACDERPPFDLCLDLADSPRGPRRYYGFGSEDEMAKQVPWGRAVLRSAKGWASGR